ncbi:hypothetical protein FOCC_FOCC017565 [Frankliniella occidentalis]|nr:hypothetical protein FOCC_FOCC017565 [Frankliniella occidentalis]
MTQMFDFTVTYRKGAQMQAPDALSRAPCNSEDAEVDLIEFDNPQDEWYNSLVEKVLQDPDSYDKFAMKDGFLFNVPK